MLDKSIKETINNIKDEYKEQELENAMLAKIRNVLLELGKGFSKDKLSVEWFLESTNVPIGVSSYEIEKYIPKDILEKLPTEEDINLYLDLDEEDVEVK